LAHGRIQHVGGAADAGFDLLATLPLTRWRARRRSGSWSASGSKCVPSASECRRQDVFTGWPAQGVVPGVGLPWVSSAQCRYCRTVTDGAGSSRRAIHGWTCRHVATPPAHRERTGCHVRPRPTGTSLRQRRGGSSARSSCRIQRLERWTQREMQKQCQPNVSLGW